ncbi:MAG: Rrf2 family transcriptional regulator [Hyphomonadaceae bacterium]|nr:Rrf2 family transcriptional regulator [Clostridia bacterium]
MKLSTKGRYGVMAMVNLALYDHEGQVALKQIAEHEGISESYLEQLIAKLRKAGLVQSIRGAQGGYKLAKSPNEISVGEILNALEGILAPVQCGDNVNCCHNSSCKVKPVWEKIHTAVNDVVFSIYLSDLIKE